MTFHQKSKEYVATGIRFKLNFPYKLHNSLILKIFNREVPIKAKSNGVMTRYYDVPFSELEAIYAHVKSSISFSLNSEKNS